MWFPRLSSDRVLRARPTEAPFAVTLKQDNAERIYCLNGPAERAGLRRSMTFADACAFCPDLETRPADLKADQRFLHILHRWAGRYSPWVGFEGQAGLVLDSTGVAHLFGGEAGVLADMRTRLARAGLSVQLGLADTRGAAWALARYREGIAGPGRMRDVLGPLPVEALRLDGDIVVALQRLGLRSVEDLAARPRAPLARRFGQGLLRRLDQALGAEPEEITPLANPPHFGVQMTLPDPIGLFDDVMAGVSRLLHRLSDKLKAHNVGARVLCLTLRRVDMQSQQVELRLARAQHDPGRILSLFEHGVASVDAGYGIDQFRIEAVRVEPLSPRQISHVATDKDRLDDLITRIGIRIGLENIHRLLPADSHIPERSFIIAAAAYSKPQEGWVSPRPRPLCLFPPEPIAGEGARPPRQFRWRRMALSCARATGPERIAPEWWLGDENWHSGIRDYWRVETRQGRRLWLFYTPQSPAWFVHGEFA